MDLAYEMSSLDGVSEDVAKLYTENNGKYLLTGIKGVSPKSKVDEFRNTNIELTNKLKTFEGIDPASVKAMTSEIDELKIRLEKTDLDEEQIDKIVQQRVETLKADLEAVNASVTAERDGLASQVNKLVLDGQTNAAAVEHGVADTALDDVINRVRSTFTVEGNKAIAKDSEGNVIYDATGTKEISVGEWVKGLTKTAPHLFKASVQSKLPNNVNYKGDASNLTATQKISAGLG